MHFLKNLSISKKVLLVAIFPFFGFLLLSGVSMQDALKKIKSSEKVLQLTDFAVQASHVMHEVQKERGLSAGFIGSSGEKFSSQLMQQRALTDQVFKEFLQHYEKAEILHSIEALQAEANVISQKIQELPRMRQRIDAMALPVASALRFYTQINRGLLTSLEEMTHFTSDQEASLGYVSYASFLEAKERAGIERAVLASAFSKDLFSHGEYERFLQLKVEQEVFLDHFLKMTDDDAREFYHQTLSASVNRAVKAFRDKAIHGMEVGSFNVSAEEWFKVASDRIEALKKVDEFLAADQEALAQDHSQLAMGELIGLSTGVGLSLLISLVLGSIILKYISQSIGVAREAAEHIANGDFDTQVPESGHDDLGEMLNSFRTMQDNLRDAAERDKAQADEVSRVKFALDSLSLSVMVADENHDIVYINQSILDMFQAAESSIRKDLPNFRANKILGTNIDVFHKNPAHQRGKLKEMKGPLNSHLVIGDSHLTFTANRVVNEKNEFIGTVVEWADRTQQVSIEADLEKIVNAAISGDLTHRAATEGREGFFLTMAESINNTLDVIANVMQEVNQTMSSLSDGDLRDKIDSDYEGIYSEVRENINATISTLASVVSKIHGAASQIDMGSGEIVQGNNNLAQRTEEQVSNIEETATSVEELTVSVQQNAENAKYANDLANTASKTAKDGGEVIDKVIHAMEDINQSSGKIVEIISVIDEIAFQTNLLALNAAVEAARAGEQGRGFAVVADEVQRLAQRSAAAAQEIQNLIQDSVQKVKVGAGLVSSSGETLTEIVKAIDGVNQVVGDISGAVQEQAIGIKQVNDSITRLDDMTQQNASLAQQTSVVSNSMRDSSAEMRDLVKHFTLT